MLAWHVHPPGRGSEKMILSGMSSDKFHALSSGELLLEHINTQHYGYEVSCATQNILNNVTLTSSRARLFIHGESTYNNNL